MIARQSGRRSGNAAVGRRKMNGKKRGTQRVNQKKDELSPKEYRQLVQLMVCGGIFVLLVAVKLLLPSRMEQINRALGSAMERNMDVSAVFSAVGDAFSEGRNVGETVKDVYQSVFGAEESADPVKADVLLPEENAGLKKLQCYYEIVEAGETAGLEAEQTADKEYILYSDWNLPKGVSMEQAILGFSYCAPVKGDVTSAFGYRKQTGGGESGRFHYGVDLAAESGTDIVSFADGTLTLVGDSSTYGKYCMVSHEGGYSTLYAHCSRITASSGTSVKRGEKIAEVGETGTASGPHLHFELQRSGEYLNPVYYVAAA